MELIWVPGPILCNVCDAMHREGLPGLWWRTRVTPLCDGCRELVRTVLAGPEGAL